MKPLRERGIYLAPDRQRFVASNCRRTTSTGARILSQAGDKLSCFLFTRYEWAFHGLPDFEVTEGGRMLSSITTTNWRSNQLVDTGATAGDH